MTPLRLIILVLLVYIALRLIRKRVAETIRKNVSAQVKAKQAAEDEPVQDTLVEDPFCHTLLPKSQAIRLREGKKVVYFCSEKCCDAYLASTNQQDYSEEEK